MSVSTVGLGDYALEKPGIGASLIVVLGCASWAVTLGLVQDTISEREYVLATLRDRLRDMRSRLFEFMRRLRDDVVGDGGTAGSARRRTRPGSSCRLYPG